MLLKALKVSRSGVGGVIFTTIFAILVANIIFFDRGYYDTMPQDLFGYYDGIYRSFIGQVPHREFSTINGTLLYAVPASFMKFGADIGSSVRYFHVVLMITAFGMLAYVQRTRLEGFIIVPLAAVVALALACKYNFGDSPFQVTEAMFYNRIGFSFITIELCLLIKPQLNGRDFIVFVDAISIGLICGFLFYIKFTFGIAGLGFACLTMMADDRVRRDKLILFSCSILSFALIVVLVEFWMGGNFAWIKDIAMAVSSDSGRRSAVLLRKAALDVPEIGMLILFPIATLLFARVKIHFYWISYAIAILCVSLLLQLYSFQESILLIPLVFIVFSILKLYDAYKNDRSKRIESCLSAMVVVYVVASAGIAYPMIVNIGIASARYQSSASQRKNLNGVLGAIHTVPQALEAAHVGKLVSLQAVALVESTSILDAYMLARKSRPMYYYDNLSFPEYEFYLQDGMAAVSKGCRQGASIATLDFVNPFPALLGWPEGGGVLFVAPELVSTLRHPDPSEMFRNINCILMPKAQANPGVREFFSEVYGAYIAIHFVKTAETSLWSVLAIKSD